MVEHFTHGHLSCTHRFEWEPVSVTPVGEGGKVAIPDEALHSAKKNTVALKTPVGKGHVSLNLTLRR